ncbi:MAG: DHH family phosphoesterase [Clostridiales bacterium]|nr:DHH family phosphoesterase [Clostridiales bacterium]
MDGRMGERRSEQWLIKNRKADPSLLAQELGISRHLAQLLICRSICDGEQARAYLNPCAEGFGSASLLKDMDKAVALALEAISGGAKLLVVGDYDVDGVMSVLIMAAALAKLTGKVAHYIPHRVRDGYGISERIVERAREDGVGLIITCDNGISAHGAVRLAKALGMGVIVTDHHEVPRRRGGATQGGVPQGDGSQGDGQQGNMPQGGVLQGDAQQGGVLHGDRQHGNAQQGGAPQAGSKQGSAQQGSMPQGGVLQWDAQQGGVLQGAGQQDGAQQGGAPQEYGLPPADAVVNPMRPDCAYPFKGLCGAAVALKFAEALLAGAGIEPSREERDEWLCFAAIATVCDIVELVGENRALVRAGLDIMNRDAANVGLSELIGACGLSRKRLTARSLSYAIGPCINATGRLESAELSYALFAERDRPAARAIALRIREINAKRKEITEAAYGVALQQVELHRLDEDPIIALYAKNTHESVAGIVAGKLRERFGKPAIVLADSRPGELKGSGRSVEGYNLLDCIAGAGGHLAKYGGHAMAVGLTLDKRELEAFRGALLAACGPVPEQHAGRELIDLCICEDELDYGLIGDLERLEPFGKGNLRPALAMTGLTLERATPVGKSGGVVRLRLASALGRGMDGVYFGGMADFAGALGALPGEDGIIRGGARADIVFYPEINDYGGTERIQLVVSAVRPSQSAEKPLRSAEMPPQSADRPPQSAGG